MDAVSGLFPRVRPGNTCLGGQQVCRAQQFMRPDTKKWSEAAVR